MKAFGVKITGLAVLALGVIFIGAIFSLNIIRPQAKSKEAKIPSVKPLGIESKNEAEELYQEALSFKNSDESLDVRLEGMVSSCQELIQQHPYSLQADHARKLLRNLRNPPDLDFSGAVDINDVNIFTNYWLFGKE